MLEFWKGQVDCPLRRVALRVCGYLISQCATERVNKIPKDIWTDGRLSVAVQSMNRDLFVNLLSCS